MTSLSSQLLFFFSALGAFNGLLFTGYVLFSKPVSLERRLLAFLMFAISIRISKSIWFYFDPDLGKQFLQLGLSSCFFIGPLLYFYIASVFGQLDKLRIKWSWHIGTLVIIVLCVGIVYPYQFNLELWGIFYRIINYSWAMYIVAAAFIMFPKLIVWFGNKTLLSLQEKLAINVFAGTALIWLAYFTASYTSYIVGALSFTFIIYLSILHWQIVKNSKKEDLFVNKKNSYATNKIDESKCIDLIKRLTDIVEKERLYTNANVTLPELAKKMQLSVPQLSRLLNDNMQKSFAVFINEFRINEAKRLLLTSPKMTVEVVAEESGYNSQSTFYNAFKQFENTTPAKYRQCQLNR